MMNVHSIFILIWIPYEGSVNILHKTSDTVFRLDIESFMR